MVSWRRFLIYGSSINLDAYIGENLSRTGDVVVCTINHRINGFGYLNLAKVGGEKFKDSPNAGMLDCVAALRWVNQNISQFGGDPNNVTIFGQSGGGAKVNILMTMPEARGLFHKAVNMSGAFLRCAQFDDTAVTGGAVVEEAGLKSGEIEKLQDMPWQQCFDIIESARSKLLKGRSDMSMGGPGSLSPCVDGLHIPLHPIDSRISSHIPLIIGNCLNEQSPSANEPQLENVSLEQVKEKLSARFKERTSIIIDAYKASFPNKKPIEIWGMLAWDLRSGVIEQANKHTDDGGKVFNYLFEWETPLYDGRPRAYHNSDIAFWFNNTELMDSITGGGMRPAKLGKKMAIALSQFAKTGNPNHKNIPNWPVYDKQNGAVMIWNDDVKVSNDPDRKARLTIKG
ncbi:MAG: carboxylesterase/lipase family protein [Chitinophagaceae bacterium]|nr:carboxylesterase/lipase family protein [Chitinophagaceae bacterium]